MVEAALTGKPNGFLDEHLRQCSDCANEFKELQARREKMDALLPLVANGAEPHPGFRAQVLAAAEAASAPKRAGYRRVWVWAGAVAAVVLFVLVGLVLHRRVAQNAEQAREQNRALPQTELIAAQRLAEWRAPSDVLLQTPGQEFLRTTPKFGESYLDSPRKTFEEK
ncbi:MAG TPA: hypothetical protein VGD60_12490 [Candidatus Acidoferrales bacterium]